MQKLLEESSLFNLSRQQIPFQYGQKWQNIQDQLKKIINKTNSKTIATSPQKLNFTARNINNKKLPIQHKNNIKQLIPQTKPSKFIKLTQQKPNREIRQELRVANQQGNDKQKFLTYKKQKIVDEQISCKNKIKSFSNCQLQLVHSKIILTNKNKQVGSSQKQKIDKYQNQKRQQSNINKVTKKLQQQIQQCNTPSEQSIIKILFKQKQNQQLQQIQNQANKSIKYQFQSLGNILSSTTVQKNTYVRRSSIDQDPLRRNSIGKISKKDKQQKENKQKNNTLSKQQQIQNNKKNNQTLIKSKIKINLNNGRISQELIKLKDSNQKKTIIEQKIKLNNIINEQIQKSNSNQHHSLIQKTCKDSKQYKVQIQDFKRLIHVGKNKNINFKQLSSRQKAYTQYNHSDLTHIQLPQIKNNSCCLSKDNMNNAKVNYKQKTSRFQPIFKTQKVKIRAKSQSKSRIQIQKQSYQSKQNSKFKEINLILNKQKDFRSHSIKPKNRQDFNNENIQKTNKQNQSKQPIQSRKLKLSSLVNGDIQMKQLFPQSLLQQRNKSITCMSYCKYQKQGTNTQRIHQNNDQNTPSQKQTNTPTKNIQKANKQKRINVQNKYPTCKELQKQNDDINQCKNKVNQGIKVGIKKNLDAQYNISLLKISLNKNRNKLVIIKR